MALDLLNLDLLALKVGAATREFNLAVRPNGKGSQAVEYVAHMPATLDDAVKMFGSKTVRNRFLRSLASSINAEKKKEIAPPKEGKAAKGRLASQLD